MCVMRELIFEIGTGVAVKGKRRGVANLLPRESNLMHPPNHNAAKPQPKHQALFHRRDAEFTEIGIFIDQNSLLCRSSATPR